MADLMRANRVAVKANGENIVADFYRTHKAVASIHSENCIFHIHVIPAYQDFCDVISSLLRHLLPVVVDYEEYQDLKYQQGGNRMNNWIGKKIEQNPQLQEFIENASVSYPVPLSCRHSS